MQETKYILNQKSATQPNIRNLMLFPHNKKGVHATNTKNDIFFAQYTIPYMLSLIVVI